MRRYCLPTMFFSLISPAVLALNLSIGSPIPSVQISDLGQLNLQQEKIRYTPWASQNLAGKVVIIQAMAGRSSAKEMNAPMIEAIKAAKFNPNHYLTLTIVNQDDAIWGTGAFVKSSLEDSKKEYPHSAFVLDAEGVAAKAWQLAKKSSAIILLDQQGVVRFAKDGALSQEEIQTVITTAKRLMPSQS